MNIVGYIIFMFIGAAITYVIASNELSKVKFTYERIIKDYQSALANVKKEQDLLIAYLKSTR